jgi:excinuclease UvrABC nuclease subunit
MHRDLTFLKEYREKHDGFIYDILDFSEINLIPTLPGAYILISHDTKFIYPEGQSKVIYIGKGDNLNRRVFEHHKATFDLISIPKRDRKYYLYYSRYQYMAKFGCSVIWFSRRGPQNAKDLESVLIELFYNKYNSLPVGNASFSFKKT